MGIILENIHKNRYLIPLGILMFSIGIFGMVTSQWLFGVVLIALIAAITFVIYSVRLRSRSLDPSDEVVTIRSGVVVVVVAFRATAIDQYLLGLSPSCSCIYSRELLQELKKRLV